MQTQMRLGDVAEAAVGGGRGGVDGSQRLGEGADLPVVFFEGVGELVPHELLQGRHVEEVGQLVDFRVQGDGGSGVGGGGFVVVLVDVGDDFVEDGGVHFFELDVFGVAFLKKRQGDEISQRGEGGGDGAESVWSGSESSYVLGMLPRRP